MRFRTPIAGIALLQFDNGVDEHPEMDQEQNGGLHVTYCKQAFGNYKARI